ncbi:MAG: hypothetical protein Salg2KO_22820 [Salibacteraceae bacterium]
MKIGLMIVSSLMMVTCMLQAQKLDLNQRMIVLESDMHHYSKGQGIATHKEKPLHADEVRDESSDTIRITIDTEEKSIEIYDVTKDIEMYNLKYTTSAQGAGGPGSSASLKSTETMFLVHGEEVLMVTHDHFMKTLHVIKNDNQIQLFGNLKFAE